MKTNKTVTSLLILVALLGMGLLYLIFKLETVNEKNYAAEKTISNYQVKNKENENEITEINQKLIKAKKDLSNQTATDKAKMDSLLSDQKTENDELLKKTLTQEQEIFLLEQKLKELDDKYKKMVCYEPKPKQKELKKTFKTIPKPISRKKVVMVKT